MKEMVGTIRVPGIVFATMATAFLAYGTNALRAEPGVTNTAIKIGMFGPLTGATSVYGYPINNGAIAVYNEVNAQGGINFGETFVDTTGGCQHFRQLAKEIGIEQVIRDLAGALEAGAQPSLGRRVIVADRHKAALGAQTERVIGD